MSLDLQYRRTSGTIYGELMRDSGITLPHGRYIIADDLASQLNNHGVRKSKDSLIYDIWNAGFYGNDDAIFTRVQILGSGHDNGSDSHLYNPWKELMKGTRIDHQARRDFDYPHLSKDGKQPVTILMENPREGIIRLQSMFALLKDINESDLEEFLTAVGTYSCTLYDEIYSNLKQPSIPEIKLTIQRMEISVPEDLRGDLQYVLKLISKHNICVSKEDLIRSEIEELMRYDTTKIPTQWEEGTLDDAVITEEMVLELNEKLKHKI